MLSSRTAGFVPVALGVPCVVAVMAYGKLSTGALVAVGLTGTVLAAVGLAGRAGEAAEPVGRDGLPWLVWLAAAVAWELLTLVDDRLPTLSDLLDPVLASPALRGGSDGRLVGRRGLAACPPPALGPDPVSGSTASLLGFAALLVTGLALEVANRFRAGPATAARALTAAMATTPGRVVVLVAWVWLGVHVLAR